MRRWTSTVLVVALSAGIWGCLSSGDPFQRALQRTDNAVESAVDALDDLDQVVLLARFNPCKCPAPDFEVRIFGRWERVLVTGEEELLEELDLLARTLDEDPGLGVFRLQGQFDGTDTFEDTGIEYELFRMVRIQPR